MKIKQAFILAGGTGSRLKCETRDIPKPLINIGGQAFIQYVINDLVAVGIPEINILAGYLGEHFIAAYDGKTFGCSTVKVFNEDRPLGTGGAVLNILDNVNSKHILILNGDSWIENGVQTLIKHTRDDRMQNYSTVLLQYSHDNERYGSVAIAGDRVIEFKEKKLRGAGYINTGIYYISTSDLAEFKRSNAISLEREILPYLVTKKKLNGTLISDKNKFIDIGIPEALEFARIRFRTWQEKPAIFWDRDNTLIEDHGYVHLIKDLKWKPGALEAIRLFTENGYRNFIVTNQSGIARGFYNEETLNCFHQRMIENVLDVGGVIDYIAYCPHHPNFSTGANARCYCRKPATGMLKKITDLFPTNLEQSVLFGDKNIDVQTAENFGIHGILIDSNTTLQERAVEYLSNDNI